MAKQKSNVAIRKSVSKLENLSDEEFAEKMKKANCMELYENWIWRIFCEEEQEIFKELEDVYVCIRNKYGYRNISTFSMYTIEEVKLAIKKLKKKLLKSVNENQHKDSYDRIFNAMYAMRAFDELNSIQNKEFIDLVRLLIKYGGDRYSVEAKEILNLYVS